MTRSEHLLLALNNHSEDFKLYVCGDRVQPHEYHALSKQLRFEKIQTTLFDWLNDELPNSKDLPIEQLTR